MGSAALALVTCVAGPAHAAETAATVRAADAAPATLAAAGPSAVVAATPPVSVTTLATGLSFPWDVAPYNLEGALVGLRGGGFRYLEPSGQVRTVVADTSDVWTQEGAEAGQTGLVLDPSYGTNRRFYTCQSYKNTAGTPVDIRVVRWHLSTDHSSATREAVIVSGIPLGSNSLHGGCRLRFAADGTLHIGTGDAFTGPAPQDKSSLAGKTLRVTTTGTAPADNPYAASGGNAAKVWTTGHRNVQGLALRPGTTEMWGTEHGPNTDDEVNLLVRGGNYGWSPMVPPSTAYNQNVPMTDLTRFPSAVPARWRSGSPTVAPSGATFLTGSQWGRWEGALAVAELKGTGVRVLTLTPDGRVRSTERFPELEDRYGRIRAVQAGAGTSLYVTTSNGAGNDVVLRVSGVASQPAYQHGFDPSPSGVSAVVRGNQVQAFVRSPGGNIFRSTQSAPGAAWSGFVQVASAVSSAPSAVARTSTATELFARGAGGQLLQATSSGGAFTAWRSLGGVISSAPSAVSASDGTVDVFARAGADDALWRLRFDGTRWGSWSKVGTTNEGDGLASAPAAGADRASGAITVLARGVDGRLCRWSATSSSATFAACGEGQRETWAAPGVSGVANPVVVTRGADASAAVSVGAFRTSVGGQLTSAMAVATRGAGYTILGRGTDSSLWAYDGRAGKHTWSKVGGTLG